MLINKEKILNELISYDEAKLKYPRSATQIVDVEACYPKPIPLSFIKSYVLTLRTSESHSVRHSTL